ncbi:MAG: hotdog fold thioesterase [Bacteroidetes bacterium]|jgi:uncharacterized protein (TIGR00369 family)|nr:hotdog fold thioesterase [Bacteroidota bacterium]
MPKSIDQIPNAGVGRLLGIEMQEASADRVVATLRVTPDHHQPFGYLHGGVSVVLAESVASVGGYLRAPEGKAAMGLEINANHVRSVKDGLLTATGTPLHTGRTTQIWEIKIRDERERLVCISRCTLAVVNQR